MDEIQTASLFVNSALDSICLFLIWIFIYFSHFESLLVVFIEFVLASMTNRNECLNGLIVVFKAVWGEGEKC